MQALNVFISAKDKRAVLRRCLARYRRGKGEHIEGALVRRSVGEFHIVRLIPLRILENEDLPPEEQYDPETTVRYDTDDFAQKLAEARKSGLELITIHSHPNAEACPSVMDHTCGVDNEEVLMGIVEMWIPDEGRAKTTLLFWIPQLPCHVTTLT